MAVVTSGRLRRSFAAPGTHRLECHILGSETPRVWVCPHRFSFLWRVQRAQSMRYLWQRHGLRSQRKPFTSQDQSAMAGQHPESNHRGRWLPSEAARVHPVHADLPEARGQPGIARSHRPDCGSCLSNSPQVGFYLAVREHRRSRHQDFGAGGDEARSGLHVHPSIHLELGRTVRVAQ